MSPFADIRSLLQSMPGPDEAARAQTLAREAELLKPPGALGRMEEIAAWAAAWSGKTPPEIRKPLVAIFAGNHGVAARGVSAYPASVTEQMVAAYAAGGAAINQLCAAQGAGLKVYDLALDHPCPDIVEADAFGSERECAATIAFGMEALAEGPDILCLGEMGIGNTTVAAALAHGILGGPPEAWVGRGTGVSDEALARKQAAVREAVKRAGKVSGLDALRRLGGREFAAMAGAILAARHQRVPVILDGFVAGAAALCLWAEDPRALDHCLAGHVSAETGHRRLLEAVGRPPLLDLGMRLGEGTGAAMALSLVRLALTTHAGMATFAQMGVDAKMR